MFILFLYFPINNLSFIIYVRTGCPGLNQLRNELDFWKAHGIMKTSGLLQSLCEARRYSCSIQDSMNLLKIEFIPYIYIFYK